MTNQPAGRSYLFDVFRVDAEERLLYKGNREIPLTPKVFDTLLALIENSSHVLTKKELMLKVRPDRIAAEIGVCVADEAKAGEVLVSRTVKDLVAGSGINFEDRGIRTMRGCGEWRLFGVQRAATKGEA